MSRALVPIIVVAASACTGPVEPRRQRLDQYLLGPWELVHIRGEAVPGYVRSCGWTLTPAGVPVFGCDSTYVAFGRVEFQSAGSCKWTVAAGTDTTRLEGVSCRYSISGDRAWIALRDEPPKELSVGSEPSGRNGYLTIVFREGCPDVDFDPCNPDWWVFRKSGERADTF